MDFFEYLSVIFAFIVVLIILLLTTKYLAYKSKKISKGNYMQIVESLSLGVNNRIHLIKVDKEFFIISSSNKNVEFLARVDIKDFEEAEIKNPITGVADFRSVLTKYLNGLQFGKQMQNVNKVADNTETEHGGTTEISNVGVRFKDNLDKLKHLSKSINGQRSENEQEKI